MYEIEIIDPNSPHYGHFVCVDGDTPDEAIEEATAEFGANGVDPETVRIYRPGVVEYAAYGRDVLALYDNGREELALTCETLFHADTMAAKFNRKLRGE